MCPLFGKKKQQRFLKEQAGEAEGRQRERAGSLSRFPNALELYSFSTWCSSRLRILVSIWGNGSAQGTRIFHGHRPELPPARASLSGSAPCPPALNRLPSRRSDPTFRASAQPSAPSPTPLWGREGGEPRHGYPWVRCDFPPSGGMRAPPVTLLGRRGCEVPVFRSPYTGPRASTSRRAVEGRCMLDPFKVWEIPRPPRTERRNAEARVLPSAAWPALRGGGGLGQREPRH